MDRRSEIDAEIADHEARVEKLRRELEIAEAELRGMRVVRDRLNSYNNAGPGAFRSGSATKRSDGGYRGGRQPGAISNIWKAILADAWREFGVQGFWEQKLMEIAARHGINLKPSDARGRMIAYAAHNYVEESPKQQGVWRVTAHAATKFGFDENAKKNEASSPSSDEEASDDLAT